jgi:hypothetical protein
MEVQRLRQRLTDAAAERRAQAGDLVTGHRLAWVKLVEQRRSEGYALTEHLERLDDEFCGLEIAIRRGRPNGERRRATH